jgi:hypothetical protein
LQFPGQAPVAALSPGFSGNSGAAAGYRRNFAASIPETSGKPRSIRLPLLP